MKIADVEVIRFRTATQSRPTRWGYGTPLPEGETREVVTTITKIVTDDGAEGYALGGDAGVTEAVVKPLLVGEDPLDRERLWHWMDQMVTFGHALSEAQAGVVDCALWDLAGRVTGLPVSKLLGGCRERVPAYASTAPNLGDPDVYAEHVRACKARGYKAYKVHANICWNRARVSPGRSCPASRARTSRSAGRCAKRPATTWC